MKKTFLKFCTGVAVILFGGLVANSIPMYTAPNGGNFEFYSMMQHQMEHDETLDYVNNSENYKKNREKKDSANKIRETNFNPNYSPNYGGTYLHPVHPVQMQFTKDKDGNIKIQGIHSNSEKIIDTKK